ncbi:hypothetical protein MRX96_025504 [Rhipicephalus microplus]
MPRCVEWNPVPHSQLPCLKVWDDEPVFCDLPCAAFAVFEVQIDMQHALVVMERRVEVQWSSTMDEENRFCCTNAANCTSMPNEIDDKLMSLSYGC